MSETNVFEFTLGEGEELENKLISLDGTATYVLRGGAILNGEGGTVRGSIVVEGNRILEIREDDPEIPGARNIDCRGKTILPGLMDLEIHFLGWGHKDRFLGYLIPRPGVKVVRAAFEAYLTLAYGFTTVRSLGHGDSAHTFGLRQAIAEGIVQGPRIYHVGWSITPTRTTGTPLHEGLFRQLRTTLWAHADGEQECRAMVRQNIADGAEVIKISFPNPAGLGDPSFSAQELSAIVDESHRQGRRVAAHATTVDAARAAVLAGVDCIEHGPDVVDRELLDLMLERGTYLVPTLAVRYRILEVGQEFGYPRALIDTMGARTVEGRGENIRAAKELVIKIALGSDNGARGGWGYLGAKELELLVNTGFTPMEAIQAGTSVAAEVLGIQDELGTLQPGKLAEMIVVDGDPLQDITIFQDPTNIVHIFQVRDRLRPERYPKPKAGNL